jgi:hypothetical protein
MMCSHNHDVKAENSSSSRQRFYWHYERRSYVLLVIHLTIFVTKVRRQCVTKPELNLASFTSRCKTLSC